MLDKLLQIKNESLHDGKGVIVHIDNFNWLIGRVERVQHLEGQLKEATKINVEMLLRLNK